MYYFFPAIKAIAIVSEESTSVKSSCRLPSILVKIYTSFSISNAGLFFYNPCL